MTCTDIFIKTYHKDFKWLIYCIRSIKKFASGFRDVVLVSDNDGHKIPQEILDIMSIKVIYKDVPKVWPPTLKHRPGYLWQQLIKLNWMEYTDASAVMIIDSDEMLVSNITPLTFKNDKGRWIWTYRRWKNAGRADKWKEPTQRVLKFEPQYEAMCFPPFILERNTTYNFIEYLKKIHDAKTLFDVFFKYGVTLFSEYNAYGSYILKFDTEVYCPIVADNTNIKRLIIKSWSYGDLTEEDVQKREAVLSCE